MKSKEKVRKVNFYIIEGKGMTNLFILYCPSNAKYSVTGLLFIFFLNTGREKNIVLA